jgi:4-aminobutyrate aminotransferase-like enzyme
LFNYQIAKAFGAEGSFFSSAGGNPVSCAVGMSVLDVIEHDQLQQNAREVGEHLSRRFGDLARRYPHVIGCIHGHGLYQVRLLSFSFVSMPICCVFWT